MTPSARRLLSILLCFAVPVIVVLAASPSLAQRQRRRQTEEQTRKKKKKDQPQASTGDRFTLGDGGKTVHDSVLHVTWLIDANVGKDECKSTAGVGRDGSMDWNTAWACIEQLNRGNFLGHSNWQMPATPAIDRTCKTQGKHGNSFGEDCSGSALGSLFYSAFQRHFGETVALQTGPTIGGFNNFQPYMYWSGTSLQQSSGKHKKKQNNGYSTFAFANGWQGANVDHHVMYVLPMIAGPVPGNSAAAKATIYDGNAYSGVQGKKGVSWLNDANIAHDPQFLQQIKATDLIIRSDGAMEQSTAQELIKRMNTANYLGRSDWALPPASTVGCTVAGKTGTTDGYQCTGSALGHLYYDFLKLKQGDAVAMPPDIAADKPFQNVQPFLYWACTAQAAGAALCASNPMAASGMGFSFSMGNGFTDTTVIADGLFLMIYYPDSVNPKCSTPMQCCALNGGTWSGGKCQLS